MKLTHGGWLGNDVTTVGGWVMTSLVDDVTTCSVTGYETDS